MVVYEIAFDDSQFPVSVVDGASGLVWMCIFKGNVFQGNVVSGDIEDLLSHMKSGEPFNQTTLSVFNELFLDYCILGGMPKIVSTYINKGTFEGTLELQQELINDYKEDIKKYVDGIDKTRVLNVFNHIPVQLAKENKKFQISKDCIEYSDLYPTLLL